MDLDEKLEINRYFERKADKEKNWEMNSEVDMDPAKRKLKQRIIKRKEKVKKMISKQESVISGLDPSLYQEYKDYLGDLNSVTYKLHRLEQELSILESGRLLHDV